MRGGTSTVGVVLICAALLVKCERTEDTDSMLVKSVYRVSQARLSAARSRESQFEIDWMEGHSTILLVR